MSGEKRPGTSTCSTPSSRSRLTGLSPRPRGDHDLSLMRGNAAADAAAVFAATQPGVEPSEQDLDKVGLQLRMWWAVAKGVAATLAQWPPPRQHLGPLVRTEWATRPRQPPRRGPPILTSGEVQGGSAGRVCAPPSACAGGGRPASSSHRWIATTRSTSSGGNQRAGGSRARGPMPIARAELPPLPLTNRCR